MMNNGRSLRVQIVQHIEDCDKPPRNRARCEGAATKEAVDNRPGRNLFRDEEDATCVRTQPVLMQQCQTVVPQVQNALRVRRDRGLIIGSQTVRKKHLVPCDLSPSVLIIAPIEQQ
jgi:hypothetical protein